MCVCVCVSLLCSGCPRVVSCELVWSIRVDDAGNTGGMDGIECDVLLGRSQPATRDPCGRRPSSVERDGDRGRAPRSIEAGRGGKGIGGYLAYRKEGTMYLHLYALYALWTTTKGRQQQPVAPTTVLLLLLLPYRGLHSGHLRPTPTSRPVPVSGDGHRSQPSAE